MALSPDVCPKWGKPVQAGKRLACIRQRNPIPFRAEVSREAGAEKHIPSEKPDADGASGNAKPDRKFSVSLKQAAHYGL